VSLEILDVAFVLLRFLKRIEGTQVAALAGRSIFLAGIEAELTGFELSYHGEILRGLGRQFFGWGFPGPMRRTEIEFAFVDAIGNGATLNRLRHLK
jgi:hypothetical protein